MKLAVLGAGSIAEIVSQTLLQMEEIECYAVAARDLERAQAFAKRVGYEKAYGSYEEMLCDPEVELVYITTPHSHHYEHMLLCIEHGKNVICEKAFTLNAKQASHIKALANEKKVYVAEAIWPRYMPSRKLVADVLKSGIIGDIQGMTANLWYPIMHNERLVNINLAGGALLDVGVYGVNFMLMHFGDQIEKIETSALMTDQGVDKMNNTTFFYKDGRVAFIHSGMSARSDRKGIFFGQKGYIIVENINNPQSISVYDTEDNLLSFQEMPIDFSGYEYEFREAVRCIREGKIEADSMPLEDSIFMMDIMDQMRAQWGLVYPQEQ